MKSARFLKTGLAAALTAAFCLRSGQAQHCLWARQISGANARAEATGLQVSDEEILFTGRADKTVRIGRTPLPASGTGDSFVLRFSLEGDYRTSDSLPASQNPAITETEPDYKWVLKTRSRNQNYYLAYGLSTPLRIPQNLNWSLAFLDGSGHRLWEHPLPENQSVNDLILLRDGKCLVVGREERSEEDSQILVALWNEYGKEVWRRYLGGKFRDEALSAAEDAEGNLYVGGFFTADSTFLGNSRDLSGNDRDGFIACFDKAGQERFLYRQRGSGWNSVRKIALTAMGNVAFAADFSGSDWRLGPFGLNREGSQDLVVGLVDPRLNRKRDNQIRIFPNPAREVVYFGLEKPLGKGKLKARLERKDGSVLQEMEIRGTPGSSYRFNVSNTEPGMYFLVVESRGKRISEKIRVE
jgi:hypothetical protein